MALSTITISADASYGGTTQAPVYMSASAPATPANGSLWWNTDNGALCVYFDDGSGSPSAQWVRVN